MCTGRRKRTDWIPEECFLERADLAPYRVRERERDWIPSLNGEVYVAGGGGGGGEWNNTAGVLGPGSIFIRVTRWLFCKLKTEGQVARPQGPPWGRGSRTLNLANTGNLINIQWLNKWGPKHYLESDGIIQRQPLWKTGPLLPSLLACQWTLQPPTESTEAAGARKGAFSPVKRCLLVKSLKLQQFSFFLFFWQILLAPYNGCKPNKTHQPLASQMGSWEATAMSESHRWS